MLRLRWATPVLPLMVALLCVAAYAGQLGLGRWQNDEFRLFIAERAWGWPVLLKRLAYAPRPFSEGLMFLYGEAVLRAVRPLVAPFLAGLWVAVLGGAVLAARAALSQSPTRPMAAAGLVSALFAFVLATNDVTELFYWPMAAAAYLPVAGAATVLMFLLSRPPSMGQRLAAGIALLVAAASCEMGAALAIGFAAAAVIEAVTRGKAHPASHRKRGVQGLAMLWEGAWWLIPGACGVVVMALLLTLRVGIVELGADAQPYTGNAVSAVGLALRRTALDLVSGADGTVLGALATKLLFAFGFAALWRQAAPASTTPGRWHAVLAVSLLGAMFFSSAAAYYHYGTLCCERQATLRFWFADLLLILAASRLFAHWPVRFGDVASLFRRAAWLPPILLTASLHPILFKLDGLRLGYAYQHLATDAWTRSWASARAGSDGMIFYLPPDGSGMLVRGTSMPLGTFRPGPDAPSMVDEIAGFFGKQSVTICQPWQNEKSWLIKGVFIPACPPHDGPPDEIIP